MNRWEHLPDDLRAEKTREIKEKIDRERQQAEESARAAELLRREAGEQKVRNAKHRRERELERRHGELSVDEKARLADRGGFRGVPFSMKHEGGGEGEGEGEGDPTDMVRSRADVDRVKSRSMKFVPFLSILSLGGMLVGAWMHHLLLLQVAASLAVVFLAALVIAPRGGAA